MYAEHLTVTKYSFHLYSLMMLSGE